MFIASIFFVLCLTPTFISSANIISDDYLKNIENAERKTPMKWSQRYLDAEQNQKISDAKDVQKLSDANQDNDPAASYHHNSYHHPTPIREYHHSSHSHHEHHEHVKEYGDAGHRDANHRDAHLPASSHHHSVPILGHMLGYVPYHGDAHHPPHHDNHPGAISDVHRSQDVHGNYDFGYETRTIDGNNDYRHEKKSGEVTEGSYGYKTDTAHAQHSYKHIPIHRDAPIYTETPKHGHHYDTHYSIPISDIPPAASGHHPHHGHHAHDAGHVHHSHVLPGHYLPNILNLGHTPEDILYHHQSPPPPLYHSEYDMDIPYSLYSHLLSDIFKSDESMADIVLPSEPEEPSAPDLASLSDAIRGIYGNNHINSYLSYLDSLMPNGIHSRLSNPPIYRDRKKKRR